MASISIPDSPVSDLLNELLMRDIIPQNKVRALKNDDEEVVDPLILMDLRHKEIEDRHRKMKSNQKCRIDENCLTPIMSIDKRKEYIIVDEEIKKCQMMFDIENRKMNKMISGIKRSGKEVKNKTKKIRKHNDQMRDLEAKLNGNQSEVEQQILTENKTIYDSKDFCQNKITSDYKQELMNLTEIKNYLDSLNDFEDEIEVEDRRAKSPCKIDDIFKDMEKLNKSFENLMINEPTDEQINQCDNLDSTEEIQNNKINDGKRLREIKGNGEECETYNASEFTESDGSLNKTGNDDDQDDDNELFDFKRVVDDPRADFREEYLAKKFWKKWIRRIKSKKNENISVELMSRKVVDSKFDSFVLRLQKSLKKRKTENKSENISDVKREKLVNYGEKFKNRFEAQKDIIEKQKRLLEEQKKKIRELEEDEIKSKQVNVGMRNEIENPKNEDRVIEKKRKDYKSYVYEEPVFLINMAKRARERKEKREKLNQIKRMKEEEKIKIKLKEDEEKKRKEEEKKYDRIKADQMEYLRKFMEEEDRKRNRMNIIEAERRIAALHREIVLHRCITSWKKLMEQSKSKIKRLHQIVDSILKRKSLHILKINNEMCKKERLILAETFRKYKLRKKYWTIWYETWKENVQLKQVSEDYNDFRLTRKALLGLLWNKERNQRELDELMLKAAAFHKKKLLSKAFQSLREFPKIMYNKRETDKRLRSWEEKVKEIIPDFSIT